MKAAIIGAGPAGLFAAWALREHGVTIIDPFPEYKPDRIFALQYLHDALDLPNDARRELRLAYSIIGLDERLVEQVGTEKAAKYQYNAKVNRPLSEENSTRYAFQPSRVIYSLRQAYRYLHGYFSPMMVKKAVTSREIVTQLAPAFDLVISTAPLPQLYPEMTWPTIDMWVVHNYVPAPMSQWLYSDDLGHCWISVDPKDDWIRATRLDGGEATEMIRTTRADRRILRKIVPPLALPTLPANVHLAGRWGSWDAGVLTHHAYYRVRNIMEGMPK